MISEYVALRAIRREVKTYQRSARDISDNGEYTVGFIGGLVRGLEIVTQVAQERQNTSHNVKKKMWMRKSGPFESWWLLRKIARIHKVLERGNKKEAIQECASVISRSRKIGVE